MEQKTRKKSQLSKFIMVIVIAIVIIIVAVMTYKYFELSAELNKYKNNNIGELKEELIKYKNKYDEVYSQLAETQNKLEEYKKNTTNNSQATQERKQYIFRRGNYTYSKRC